jgi:hypothetical protein
MRLSARGQDVARLFASVRGKTDQADLPHRRKAAATQYVEPAAPPWRGARIGAMVAVLLRTRGTPGLGCHALHAVWTLWLRPHRAFVFSRGENVRRHFDPVLPSPEHLLRIGPAAAVSPALLGVPASAAAVLARETLAGIGSSPGKREREPGAKHGKPRDQQPYPRAACVNPMQQPFQAGMRTGHGATALKGGGGRFSNGLSLSPYHDVYVLAQAGHSSCSFDMEKARLLPGNRGGPPRRCPCVPITASVGNQPGLR